MIIQMSLWIEILSEKRQKRIVKIFSSPYFIGCRSKSRTNVLWLFLHATAQTSGFLMELFENTLL